jgi:hypothetical protein
MIGLMFMAGLIVWLAAAIYLSIQIPRRLGMKRFKATASIMLFPILLILPIIDELIGRWQFHRLCEREAVIWLSPDWERVKRAKSIDIPSDYLEGYLIRIQEQSFVYIDVDTGKPFFRYKAFHTYGGILLDRFGLRLDSAGTSCWPPNSTEMHRQVNIDQLIQQGKQGVFK